MGQVMVPVPEEHVEQLRLELMRLTLGMAGWTDETAEAFAATLDGPAKRLVMMVATAAADHDRLRYDVAARNLGVEAGDVLSMVTSLNVRCQRSGWPMPLITDALPVEVDGEADAVPVLAMVRPVALKLLGRADLGDPDDSPPPVFHPIDDL